MAHLLSQRLYDFNKYKSASECPVCHKESKSAEFFKFSYFPELLNVTMAQFNGGKAVIPKYLDLSKMGDRSDTPDISPSKGKAVVAYRLQSLITISARGAPHYVAYLRRGEDQWDCLNDLKSGVETYTWSAVSKFRQQKPRLLMYVRDRTENGCGGSPETGPAKSAPAQTLAETPSKPAPVNKAAVETEPAATGSTSEESDQLKSVDNGVDKTDPEAIPSSPRRVAIPSDLQDAKIEASRKWTVAKFAKTFSLIGLCQLPKGAKKNSWRERFLKHYRSPRDYAIYTTDRLMKAVKEAGLSRPNDTRKDNLVQVLTAWDRTESPSKPKAQEGQKSKRKREGDDEGERLAKKARPAPTDPVLERPDEGKAKKRKAAPDEEDGQPQKKQKAN